MIKAPMKFRISSEYGVLEEIRGGRDVHVYGHLDEINVKAGDHVDAGSLIGLSGNTGHSTGPHLHFALVHDGEYADPSHLANSLQHFSGDIDGPSLLAVKGPATWIAGKAIDHAKEHVVSNATSHVMDFLREATGVIVDLSYGLGLISCAVLIILGALGLRDGYRWSGLVFGSFALVRLVLGGVAR